MEEEGTSNGCKEDNNTNANARLSSLLSNAERDFLLSPTGDQVKVSDLEGSTVGLYFAANWQPQCRIFTNLLTQIYNHLNASASANANAVFEVVFVSSDEDSSAFSAFRASMPWLSLPFSDLPTKKSLSQRFQVEAIPSLIILLPGGGVGDGQDGVVLNGVEIVYQYGAEAFPFTRNKIEELERRERLRHETQTLVDLMTHRDRDYVLAHPDNTKVPVLSLVGKTVGLYFSAQWCYPCTRFTPKLISLYHKIKQTLRNTQNTPAVRGEEDFEIVFVSSDRDERSFQSYFNTMPFFALPNGDATIKSLAKHFDVRDIPCLVILGPDGKTVTKRGRNLLNLYGDGAYPFTLRRIESLERKINDAARNLPTTVSHVGHTRHPLSLVSEGSGGGPYICCGCDEQGSGWAYLCLECGYEVHPRCVRTVDGDELEGLDGSTVRM